MLRYSDCHRIEVLSTDDALELVKKRLYSSGVPTGDCTHDVIDDVFIALGNRDLRDRVLAH